MPGNCTTRRTKFDYRCPKLLATLTITYSENVSLWVMSLNFLILPSKTKSPHIVRLLFNILLSRVWKVLVWFLDILVVLLAAEQSFQMEITFETVRWNQKISLLSCSECNESRTMKRMILLWLGGSANILFKTHFFFPFFLLDWLNPSSGNSLSV
jgi:hypothetical protein